MLNKNHKNWGFLFFSWGSSTLKEMHRKVNNNLLGYSNWTQIGFKSVAHLLKFFENLLAIKHCSEESGQELPKCLPPVMCAAFLILNQKICFVWVHLMHRVTFWRYFSWIKVMEKNFNFSFQKIRFECGWPNMSETYWCSQNCISKCSSQTGTWREEQGEETKLIFIYFNWAYLTADGPVLPKTGNYLFCFHVNEEPVLISGPVSNPENDNNQLFKTTHSYSCLMWTWNEAKKE